MKATTIDDKYDPLLEDGATVTIAGMAFLVSVSETPQGWFRPTCVLMTPDVSNWTRMPISGNAGHDSLTGICNGIKALAGMLAENGLEP